MPITVNLPGDTGGADVVGPVEPSIKFHGLSWFDMSENDLKIYDSDNTSWTRFSSFRQTSRNDGGAGSPGQFSVVMGGWNNTDSAFGVRNEYFTISTLSTATDWVGADMLTAASYRNVTVSNGINGRLGGIVFATNTVDYLTVGTTSNAVSLNNLTDSSASSSGGPPGVATDGSNGNALMVGRKLSSVPTGIISKFNVTLGTDCTQFGSMNYWGNGYWNSGVGVSNGSNDRMLLIGGNHFISGTGHVDVNVIQYLSISAGANAVLFGELPEAVGGNPGTTSNDINNRAVMVAIRSGYTTNIDYVNMLTPMNATAFASLVWDTPKMPMSSNGIDNRACRAGGWGNGGSVFDGMEYFSIDVIGQNSVSFGTLNRGYYDEGAASNGAL